MQQYNRRRLFLICLLTSVLALVIAATGCGSTTATASQSQPAPSPTPSPVAEAAHVTISPTMLDFGSVAVGSKNTIGLTITNTKGSTATVAQVNISGSGFSFTSPSSTPFTLAAGNSVTVNVTFAPALSGTANGSISVLISGGASPSPTSLIGVGLAANQLGLTPTSMDFGSVTVGTTKSQAGSLTAAGSDITVSSASWNGAGYALSGISFPITVPAGQSVPFTVTFTPQTVGTSAGTVSFISTAINTPTSEALTGTGAALQHSVDLSWSPSTSSVVGYNVYRGTQTGGPYARLNAAVQSGTTYTDSGVVSGATYFYVVTAVDSGSQESTFSNETTAVIPVP